MRTGSVSLAELVDEAMGRCRSALAREDQDRIASALRRLGVTDGDCVAAVGRVTEHGDENRHLLTLRSKIAQYAGMLPSGAFERYVVTAAACESIRRLDAAPLSATVKRLCCEAFCRFAEPAAALDAEANQFIAICKIATLRRFPAGQFDWEPSGLPRSWIPLVRPFGAFARVLRLVATEWKGFGPAFFVHMGAARRNFALFEREAHRSYYRMARSMELQPRIKGLMVSSWLHSPDTFSVSPHLTWLNTVFRDNGAIVATMGAAPPDCGVLHRSPERLRAYEEGRFRPTLGLVLWPRDRVLRWANRHPELDA
jgi:hypothetical protein